MSYLLAYPLFNGAIEFSENEILQIVIENKRAFVSFLNDIIINCNGEESNAILSENLEELSFQKSAEVICNYLYITENDKAIISKLYSLLDKKSEDSSFISEKNKMDSLFCNFIENLSDELDISVDYSDSSDFKQILKAFNVKIEDACNDSLCEKIINYVKLKSSLLKTRIFVFVNLKSFLTDEEINELYKYFTYNKLIVILLESSVSSKLDLEKTVIMDNDLCQIC